MSALLPLKESSRELIVEVAHALEPYFPDITAAWRERVQQEFAFDGRVLAALERLKVSTGCSYFSHGDFAGFYENLNYFGTRLAKLEVDTRAVARSLEFYQLLCEPYLGSLFGDRHTEAIAALEMLSSATFVTVSGAYFDTKTKQSAALLSVLDAELSAGDLGSLLERVLRISVANFGAGMGVVLLREPDSDQLQTTAAVGLDGVTPEELFARVGDAFSGRIAQTGEPALMLDTARDERIASPALRRSARSLWGVPMKTENAIIGVLLIGFPKPYEWLPTERELLRAIADRTALAIHRARITDTLRERETRIAELSGHLLRVQEQERKRISRELHDETGQALMVIRLYLGMLENSTSGRGTRNKIRETLAVVDRTIDGIRRIIARLSPLVLQELGLIAAIRKEAKDLAKATGVKARVAAPDAIGRLGPETEAAIYRVVQEALHNVAKHAQAKSVNIQIGRENGKLKLLVEDDGVGMAPSRNLPGHSFGLVGIKERIAMLGGEVRVVSARGKGTRIEVIVPAEDVGQPLAAVAAAPGGVHA
ncbi:MAG TPA: GAF domain-containing sensor histidine kinase [Terriglobales bacterium]|nr:GAF domain-containing sensor histidine kinase [Terriglobales bacterium]